MRKRTSTEQSYEPLVTPENWKGDELRFSVRLTQILDGIFARLRAMRTELAGKLGRTEQAADSAKLGGTDAGSFSLKTDTAPNAEKLGGKAPSEYALQTELSGKLGRNEKAADSAKLGGLDANRYMKYTDAVEILPSANYSVGAALPFSESPDNFKGLVGRINYSSFTSTEGQGSGSSRRHILSSLSFSGTDQGASLIIVQASILGQYKTSDFILEKVIRVTLNRDGTVVTSSLNSVQLGGIMGKKYV